MANTELQPRGDGVYILTDPLAAVRRQCFSETRGKQRPEADAMTQVQNDGGLDFGGCRGVGAR